MSKYDDHYDAGYEAYIDGIHRDIADLQAENEKLKHELALETFRGAGEIEAYRRETSVAVKKAAQAKAENDKLRELVSDMMRFFEDGDYCTICEKAAECESLDEYGSDCLMRSVFKARMAELGIEADA